MTTGYQQFPITEPFNTSHPKLLSNDKNALTNNADTAFPTGTLFDGMSCYRTDEKAIYLRVGNAWKQWALFTDLPLKETVSNTRYVRTDAVNQAIAGSKTFSSALTVNANVVSATAPTAVNHLTNKKYVDDGLATKQPKGDYATNAALTQGLATKQPTGDYATNTALKNGLDQKLSLNGGQMTGGIGLATHNYSNNSYDIHIGAGSRWNEAATIVLRSSGANASGAFELIANSGEKSARLYGTPSGGLSWANKNIARSVNGVAADPNGNIDILSPLPTGTCICGLYTTIPEGFLSMDGSKIMLSDYPNLVRLLWNFAAFRGDGSTHAYLPNMHHRFFEGTTTLSEVGTYVEAGLPNISGQILGYGDRTGFGGAVGAFYVIENQQRIPSMGDVYPNHNSIYNAGFEASRSHLFYGRTTNTVQVSSIRYITLVRT